MLVVCDTDQLLESSHLDKPLSHTDRLGGVTMSSDVWRVRCRNAPSQEALKAYWKLCCQIVDRLLMDSSKEAPRSLTEGVNEKSRI